MALRKYNPSPTRRTAEAVGTADERAAAAAVALERLRNGEIVSKHTGESITKYTTSTGNILTTVSDVGEDGLDPAQDNSAYLDDDSQTIFGTNSRFIDVTVDVPAPAAGTYVIINKIIRYAADAKFRVPGSSGIHVYFFNCVEIFEQVSTSSGTTGDGMFAVTGEVNTAGGGADQGPTAPMATSSSLNKYGTETIVICNGTTGNAFNTTVIASELFDSTLEVIGHPRSVILALSNGARIKDFTWGVPQAADGFGGNIALYGAPGLIENLSTLEGTLLNSQNGGGGYILTEPSFEQIRFDATGNIEQQVRYLTQSGSNAVFQVIGPWTPLGNAQADNLGNAGTTRNVYSTRNDNSSTCGVINYYGWQKRFFEDVAQTIPILGARVRVRTDATLVAANYLPATSVDAADLGTFLNGKTSGEDIINEFISTAQGTLAIDSNTRFTSDGSTAGLSTGVIDWLQLSAKTDTGASTATSFPGVSIEDGMVIAPIQSSTDDAWRSYDSRYQARSYTHDIDIDDPQNGTIGTGEGNQPGDTSVPIDRVNIIGASLIGSRIKPANINADLESTSSSVTAGATTMNVSFSEANQAVALIYWGLTASNVSFSLNNVTYDGSITLTTTNGTTTGVFTISSGTLPTIAADTAIIFIGDNTSRFTTFTADSTVSLNDIGNALRAGWASYNVNANQGTQLQTGAFNETTYPTRIHIRTAAETGGNTWQDPKWGVKVASAGSGGQIRIAVLGNGIAGKDDDLYETLPGARTYNFAGLPLSNVVLGAQERLARVGNVHNVELTSGLDSAGPSGANDYYDIQFELDTNTITGLTTLTPGSGRVATQAVINLPTVVGDADSDITLTRGRIIQSFSSGATVGVEGIKNNSIWTGMSTTSDVNSTILPTITITGGTHAMVISGANTTAATWTFRDIPTMTIDLPTALPTGLVTIDTGATDADQTQRDIVRAWLVSQVGASNFSEEPLAVNGGTPPTSGYWLLPAVIPAREYSIQPLSYTNAGRLEVINNTTKASIEIVNVTAGGTEAITFDSDAHPAGTEIAMLWKPYTHNTHTTIRVATLPDADTSYDLADNTIVNEILAAFVDVSANVATPVLGSPAALAVAKNANSISANITGYDSSRADGATSQLVWRQVMASAAYALSVANLYKAGTIEINEYGTNALDYIRPTGTSTTGCDFRFFTITSNAVQRFTAVAHLDTTTEVEAISATVTGPLTDIGVNPAGIQSSEVVTAVTPIITETANTLSNEVDEGFDQMATALDTGILATINGVETGRTI